MNRLVALCVGISFSLLTMFGVLLLHTSYTSSMPDMPGMTSPNTSSGDCVLLLFGSGVCGTGVLQTIGQHVSVLAGIILIETLSFVILVQVILLTAPLCSPQYSRYRKRLFESTTSTATRLSWLSLFTLSPPREY